MIPDVIFLTSSELQQFMGNTLSEDEMAELQAFRDTVMARFQDHRDALAVMEELYGKEWRAFDLEIWMFDGPQDSISSPILIPQQDEQTALFEAFRLLAVQLVRGHPPDSELVHPGHDRLDAVTALLAKTALEQVMDADAFTALMAAVEGEAEDVKRWRAVETFEEQWDEEQALYDWVDGR